MAALTITGTGDVKSGVRTKINKVIFSFTSAAAETGTTPYNIYGTLLRFTHSGGDAAYDFTLNDGDADIFTKTGLNTAAVISGPLTQVAAAHVDDESHFSVGIPIAGPLKCTMANNSTAGGSITIYYREE